MTRLRPFTTALAAVALVSFGLTAQDAAKPAEIPEGKFTLAYGIGTMQRIAIVEITKADGKPTAKVISKSPNMAQVDLETGTPTLADGMLKLPINLGTNKLAFEGKPDPKNPKRYLGTFGDSNRIFRGELAPTDLAELAQKDAFPTSTPSEPAKAIAKLRAAENKLRTDARTETDADAKKKLLDEAVALKKKNAPEIAKLQAKLASAGEGYESASAALQLLGGAGKADASEADVTAWMKAIEDEAAPTA